MTRRPRAATIIAKTDCYFGILDKTLYQKILGKKQKEQLENKTKFIHSIPFFKTWTNITLSKFSYFFNEEKFYRNQVVFKAGDSMNKIYIVRHGEFEVWRK